MQILNTILKKMSESMRTYQAGNREKLFPKTKKQMQPSAELISRLGITADQAKDMTFYEAVPAPEISGDSGYAGRLAIHEVMLMNEELARLVMDGTDANAIKDLAVQQGMIPLALDGVRCIGLGITSPEEVLAVSYIEEAAEKTVEKDDKKDVGKAAKK
jgi:type II secretory ATPase GspE/PulE/Tfp pilus assembly ATPase PilB-like protein